MGHFFVRRENQVFTVLATLIALTMLFFIAPQSTSLTMFDLHTTNDRFYVAFLLLGVLAFGSILYFASALLWRVLLTQLLLITFPGALILLYGLIESNNFHYIFPVALGGYTILTGILLSAAYFEKQRALQAPDDTSETARQWLRSQGLPSLLLVIFLTSLFFVFGLRNLTHFAAVDEALWYEGRIGKYWNNIAERDWKGTRISDKPGVTVALTTWPGLFSYDPKRFDKMRYLPEEIGTTSKIEDFFFAFRFPLLLAITLILPLFYFFLERLIGRRNALQSYAFLALSPILIGMSKIINPDSLLWLFAPLSLLSYLVFLKRRSFRYLVFAGILLGLALLTKYVANILFVFFLGLIFLEYLFHADTRLQSFATYLKRSLTDLLVLTFVALTTFYILFPATWVKPDKLLSSTLFSQAFEKVAPLFLILIGFILLDQWLGKSRITSAILDFLASIKHWLAAAVSLIFLAAITFVVYNTWSGMTLYDFQALLSSPKTIGSRSDFLGVFLTNFYPFIFGVSPLLFLLLFLAPVFFWKKHFGESVALRTSFYFIIFILLYFLGTTVNSVAAIVRYQIILFPLAAIIAGITLEHLVVYAHRRLKVADTPTPIITALFITFFGIMTLVVTPFPLSYANVFLPAKYFTDVKDMGPGSYETAMYLNSLPDAENLLVWTDKDGVCKFFVGHCRSSNRNYLALREEGLDYIVVSATRKNRTTNMFASDVASQRPGVIHFASYYDRSDPVFQVNINDRTTHYVKVFKFKP